jgi:hypothetical protein
MIAKTIAIVTIAFLPFAQVSARADSIRNLSTSHAEGRTGTIPALTVWEGTGLTLNFTSTGERIVRAWLDDPSRLTLDFDACSGEGNRSCAGGASIVHLRRISSLPFARLPATPTTLLTIVTEGQETRKVYYFQMIYGSGPADYIAVNINPDPRPVLQERQEQKESTRSRVDRLARGLEIARKRDNSAHDQKVLARVETLLALVRGGASFQEALQRVNLAPSVLDRLENLASAQGDPR